MQRTGRLIYTTLIEIDAITGLPTGNVKPNVPGDPDYIPPVDDPVTCPLLPEPTTTTTLAPPVILLNFNGVNYGPGSTVNLGQNYNIDFEFRNLSAYPVTSAPHPNGGTVQNSDVEVTDPTYSIKWTDVVYGAWLFVSVPIDGDIFQANDYLQYSFNYEWQGVFTIELAIYDPSNGGAVKILTWYIGLGTP